MTLSAKPARRLAVLALVASLGATPFQGAAFAAGAHVAKPAIPYHGPCALTAPFIRSTPVAGHCVAVSARRL